MQITKLELTNYKCFEHLVLDDLGNRVVLVGPNGCGKSTILEAIAVVKEFTGTYNPDTHIYEGLNESTDYAKSWDMDVPLPIRGEADLAIITADFLFNEADQRIMKSKGQSRDRVGVYDRCTITVKIDRFGQVDTQTLPPSPLAPPVAYLFQHFDPASGVGVVDYIGADRVFPTQKVKRLDLDTLSIRQQRLERIELFKGKSLQKFQAVKQFIVSEQLNDLSVLNATGVNEDSLRLLKDLFHYFFGPKFLVGSMQRDGEFKVMIRTPNGDHDIDQLSSGEKELFMVFVNLFRIRHLPSVILYDEPERHLNPGLEAKLIPALDRLTTENQIFLATHATELIDSVPMQEIIALKREGGSSQPERFRDPTKTDRVRLFEAIGVKIGLQLASNRVVFLEGEKSSTDKKLLDRLAGPMLPGVLFVASGGTAEVMGSGTRAGLLIEEASKDSAFLMVLDRDFRSAAGVVELTRRLNDRVFIWSCHETENLLLMPHMLLEVLRANGVTTLGADDEIKADLHSVAVGLKDQFVRHWAAYRISSSVTLQATGSPRDEAGFRSMIAAQRERYVNAYSDDAVNAAIVEAETGVTACLADDSWMTILPGKELLDAFRQKHLNRLPGDLFREQIVFKMLETKNVPLQIEELCRFIQSK